MLLATKVVSNLVYPLGMFFTLMAASVVIRLAGMRQLATGVAIVAVAGLWVASTPVFAKWFIRGLEAQYPPMAIDNLPEADVAVLLGGTTEAQLPPRQRPDLHASADRIVHAADLYRAGKVGAVIASGGELPWVTGVLPEAERMASFLVDLGVPRDSIIIEDVSRTTYENAVRVGEIFKNRGFRSGLLVTSAHHMPRAIAVFEKAGVPVVASSTDVIVAGSIGSGALAWMPDANALEISQRAVKERVGYLVYWLRGWI